MSMDFHLSRSKLPPGASMQDRIRASLEEEIVSGVRPPGSPIDEKLLASQFEASRTPVREALLMLAAQNLVHIVPRSGIFVRQASAAELVALVEALEEIEVALARLAARRISAPQREALCEAQKKSAVLALANDRKRYGQANAALHSIIYQASNNPVLVEYVRSVRKRVSAYRQHSFDAPGRLAASSREHKRIVAAICNGDAEQSAAAMRAHINMGGDAMVDLLLNSPGGIGNPPPRRSRTARAPAAAPDMRAANLKKKP